MKPWMVAGGFLMVLMSSWGTLAQTPPETPAPGIPAPPAPAAAPPPATPPPAATQQATAPEHSGNYFRLMLGGGYASMSQDRDVDPIVLHGLGVGFDLHAGTFVRNNIAVGADLSMYGLSNPTLSMNGRDIGESNAHLTVGSVGVGVTGFEPDSNVYGSLGLGLAFTSTSTTSDTSTARGGFDVNALVGKEWWITQHWGLGGAGQFFYMRIPAGNSVAHNVVGGGILISTSYNAGGG